MQLESVQTPHVLLPLVYVLGIVSRTKSVMCSCHDHPGMQRGEASLMKKLISQPLWQIHTIVANRKYTLAMHA